MVLSTTISGISRHKAGNSLDCGLAYFFSILIRSFNEKWISVSKLSQRWAALWTRWCQTWISEFSVHTQKSYLCLWCWSINTRGASITSLSFKALFYHVEYFSPLSYIVIAVCSPASWCVWSDISLQNDDALPDGGRSAVELMKLRGAGGVLGKSSLVPATCAKRARKCSEQEASLAEISFSCQKWKTDLILKNTLIKRHFRSIGDIL